jgi:hypothetical protein
MFKTPALVLPTLVATQFTLASARMGKHGQSRQLQRAASAANLCADPWEAGSTGAALGYQVWPWVPLCHRDKSRCAR